MMYSLFLLHHSVVFHVFCMLIAVLFVLSTAKVNGEPVDQDGLRKSSQLDLGLQDIHPIAGETSTTAQLPSSIRNDVIGAYLPPAPSSEFAGAQSQQAFDFKSVNSVENESKPCKSSFDNCDFKGSSTSDSKIPKPSRDLVPPFNDLKKEFIVKETGDLEGTKQPKIIADNQNKIITTTEKIVTETTERAPTRTTTRIITTTPSAKFLARKGEATNELRSYLPPQPEFSAAAQTNTAVVQPFAQNRHSDHDHHHGHHGEDFNICADAFHSFLCAPLKARKRITGALPESLKTQSSFINYQNFLLSFDRETAPSNTFRNEYLPPDISPTNLIQSNYLSPLTTKRPTSTIITTLRPYSLPKITSEPSSSIDKFHFAQVGDNKFQNPSFVKPAPSSQEYSTVRPSAISTPATFSATTSSIASSPFFQKISTVQKSNASSSNTAVFHSVASNENKFYLPPIPNPQSSASVISTSQNNFPITSTFSSRTTTFTPSPAVSTFAPLSSNSIFVPQKPKVQPSIPPSTTTVRTTIFTFTPKPIIQSTSITAQPSKPRNSFVPPAPKFQSTSTTTTKPLTSTFKYSEQSSNTDRSYLPPDFKEPAAAQISSAAVAAPQTKNPFHHGRDLCTDPFHSFLCTSAKPRKRITGQVPSGFKPESSNTDETSLKPEPSNQDENKISSDKPLENAPTQNSGYKHSKTINPLPTSPTPIISSTEPTSTTYSYSKSYNKFPSPSQEIVKFTSVANSVTSNKLELVPNPSEARVVSGYQYVKPDKVFPLPAEQENAKVVTTTTLPTTGYSYPRPQKPFPLPTEQKEIVQKVKQETMTSPSSNTPLPTNQIKGYQYSKPDQSLKLPEKKGYSYPKPEKRLELPNESRSKFLLPQSNSNLDALKNLGSADFIPVNKIEYKRAEPSKLLMGMRRFGERMKKRERQAQLLKRQLH